MSTTPMRTATQALSTFKPGESANDAPAPRMPPSPLAQLFRELQSKLGTKYDDIFGSAEPTKEATQRVMQDWGEGLAGYRASELSRGLRHAWVFAPNIGEFKRACRPSLDPEAAWAEAELGLKDREQGKTGEWTHPAVWRAACTMSLQIRSGEYSRHKARWKTILNRELAHGWQDNVPAVPPRLNMTNAPPAKPDSDLVRNARALALRLKAEHAAKMLARAVGEGAP